jgi:hypothetical protein
MAPLFYDDKYHAIRAAIENGKGYKATASHLWSAMKPESAYARLKVCLREDGDQALRFGEVIELCRFNGCFDPIYWACDETDHDRPARRSPKDKQAELLEAFARSVEESKRIAQMLERLTPALKSVA